MTRRGLDGFAIGQRRWLVALGVAIAFFAPAAVRARPALASFPGENGKITFAEYGSTLETTCLYSVNADGSGRALAASCQGPLDRPAWAADGHRLAYEGAFGQLAYVTDGQSPTNVYSSGNDTPGVWSPDGQRLAGDFVAYSPTGTCSSTLFTIAPSGSGYSELRHTNCSPIYYVNDWSPNGDKILLTRLTDNADDLVAITSDGASITTLATGSTNGSWSPDGKKIVFESGGIWTMNADGSGKTRLTSGPDDTPVWSPDGRRVAFTRFVDLSNYDIHVVNADGTGETNITNSPTWEHALSWQPITRNYPRPKGATTQSIALVPAFKACASPNSTHGAPLSRPSCAPPVPVSSYLTVGTADSNGKATNSSGSLAADVEAGDPGTPADEADVVLRFALRDVRKKADLSDYTGQLAAVASARITDKYNGWGGGSATAQDLSYRFTVPCVATTDTTIGSTCAVTTTADTLVPGTIREGKRAIWELGSLQVFDGGADGLASTTADNTLFESQGIFVP
jgi:Tol biopolymer transport system component